MKIRRYTCKDMQEALIKVKMDLGSEAVIMNSRKIKPKGLKGLFSKPMLEVVAAVDDDHVPSIKESHQIKKYSPLLQEALQAVAQKSQRIYGKSEPLKTSVLEPSADYENEKIANIERKLKNMENTLKQIYSSLNQKGEEKKEEPPKIIKAQEIPSPTIIKANEAPKPTIIKQENENILNIKKILTEHDVEPVLIDKIINKIKERGGSILGAPEVANLASKVVEVLLGKPEPIVLGEKRPHIALFIGPTGVGKTTTLAKIAADFALNRQNNVGFITADTYRIAAVEQLKTYAEILGVPLNVVYSPEEISDAVKQLSDKDLILIDTAGRSHKNKEHFDELKKLVELAGADEIYLVISCNSSRMAIKEMLEAYTFVKSYKLIFTKLDESPALGAILNARYMTGKPLSYTTSGQSVPDDLDIVDTKQLVLNILAKYQI
ncbi:MAG: flagellar biosynthesis protein FlhF [Clostridiaceae bacterium]|nr:flagellar biosynthesis protein FlhF [Clostridiaceae bacterium]